MVDTCRHTYIPIYIYTYIHIYIYTHTHMLIYTHVYIYIYMCIYVYEHTDIDRDEDVGVSCATSQGSGRLTL